MVLPRDYRTPRYNPLLYDDNNSKQEYNSLNKKLPTIDDVEHASKSIQDTSIADDRLMNPLNYSKLMHAAVDNSMSQNSQGPTVPTL